MSVCTPARPLRRSAQRLPRPTLIGELLVVVWLLWVYDLARSAADVRKAAALTHGETILRVEAWLRLDVERAINLWTGAHGPVARLVSEIYQYAHIPVTLSVLGWAWWHRPDLYRPARNALAAITVGGLVVFLLLPVAPPRLLSDGGFVDLGAAAGFGPGHGVPVRADQYGAMPSLHVAWAVWSAVVAVRLFDGGPATRRLCWLYPGLVTVVVVTTANHYLLDALAGGLIAAIALQRGLVSRLHRGWRAGRPRPGAPVAEAARRRPG